MPPLRLAGIVLVAVTVLPSVACAQPEESSPEDEYRALIEDAVRLSREGQLQEALALFVRAHELRPSARTLRGLGLVRFGLSDYAGAIRALEASLIDERRPLEEDDRREARTVLDQAYRFVARIELRVSPGGARVSVDGQVTEPNEQGAVLVNPGRHEILLELEGHAAETRTMSVEGGRAHTLELTLRPDASVEEPAAAEQVALRVQSAPSGLVLHAFPLRDGEPDANAVSEVCAAPCSARLPAGVYRLGIARRLQPAVAAGTYRVEEPLDLMLHLDDRGELRLAGWLTIIGSAVAAGVALASIAALRDQTSWTVMGLVGGGVLAVGLGVGIPLAALSDAHALELRPRRSP